MSDGKLIEKLALISYCGLIFGFNYTPRTDIIFLLNLFIYIVVVLLLKMSDRINRN